MAHYAFVKGHGTRNDFVLLPDAGGERELTAGLAVALCDRRSGIGADGVIRVVRTDATDDPDAVAARGEATWFMDYRNADGSLSQMCGNGIRVLGLYLATHADIDPRSPLPIATRDGVKELRFVATDDGVAITVDMGPVELLGETTVGVGERSWPAHHVSTGNPHAVAFVDDLADAGDLRTPPSVDAATFPEGVNVEFVVRTGERQLAMRVHERGSGETQSCGTGACAVAVTAMVLDGAQGTSASGAAELEQGQAGAEGRPATEPATELGADAEPVTTPEPGTAGPVRGVPYTVDLPGGRLEITWTPEGRVVMTGPAVLVAEGVTSLQA